MSRVGDVFGAGDQLDTRPRERQPDSHVIFAVAGEPVNFVHDQVAHSALLNVFQQLLKLWPVSCLGRLARIDIFTNDDCAKRVCFGSASLPLIRD
jgi:hypothetical protein